MEQFCFTFLYMPHPTYPLPVANLAGAYHYYTNPSPIDVTIVSSIFSLLDHNVIDYLIYRSKIELII